MCEYCHRLKKLRVDYRFCSKLCKEKFLVEERMRVWLSLLLEERCLKAQQIYDEGEFVLCLECGVKRVSLAKHLKVHNLSRDQYLKKFPLMRIDSQENQRVRSNAAKECSKRFEVVEKRRSKMLGRKDSELAKQHKKEAANRPEMIEKQRQIQKLVWTEEKRKEQSVVMNEVMRTKEMRAKCGKRAQEIWDSYTDEQYNIVCESHERAMNRPEVIVTTSRASKKAWAKKTPEQLVIEAETKRIARSRPEVIEKWIVAGRRTGRRLIAEGTHNWPGERPCNNPTERVYDLFFVPIFLADTNHNFKPENQDGREFQLDFVSWPLRFNVEADEPDHERAKKIEKDRERDQFIVDSKELDFVYRYTTKYSLENMIDVIKRVYDLVNQQREKYRLEFSVLEFDERWTSYCLQMQELLKEWLNSKEGARRFKIFRNKKREIDKLWLELLEETCKKYDSNFVIVYREILEKNLKLSFRDVISIYRTKERK